MSSSPLSNSSFLPLLSYIPSPPPLLPLDPPPSRSPINHVSSSSLPYFSLPSSFVLIPNFPSCPSLSSSWPSLFKKLLCNASKYKPQHFVLNYDPDNAIILPPAVLEAGANYWSNHLVGFFLDKPFSYSVVTHFLWLAWGNLKGVRIKSDGKLFFFEFEDENRRAKILESDPLIIRGKVFIVSRWNATIDCV